MDRSRGTRPCRGCAHDGRGVPCQDDDTTHRESEHTQTKHNTRSPPLSQYFVGASKRTNSAGVAALRHVFAPLGVPVTVLPVSGLLHLKSLVTAAAPGVLVVSACEHGKVVAAAIAEHSGDSYTLVPAQSSGASNVVYVNGHLIHRSSDEYAAAAAAGCVCFGRFVVSTPWLTPHNLHTEYLKLKHGMRPIPQC